MLTRLLHRSHSEEVRAAVPRLTAARLTGNTVYRAAPPFLPQIARTLGVSLGTMGVVLAVGEMVGLSAPFVGQRIDRADRQRAMVVGLVLLAVAATIAATSPGVAMFAVAIATISLAKTTYDVGMGAWIGDRVGYGLRAQVVGLTETSWAGAMLIGIPVLAVVAALSSWRLSYGVAGAASLAMAVVIARGVAHDPPHAEGREHVRFAALRAALPAFLAVALLMSGAQMVFVVFGAWLDDAYGFGTLAVGGVSFVLGVGELLSSASSSRFTDRLGKRRAVMLGAVVMVPCGLALSVVGHHTWIGITVLWLFVVGFEFAIVSSIPLVTELVPGARAASIGVTAGMGTVGRGLAALVSTTLYTRHGMGASGAAAAVCGLGVLVLMATLVREPATTSRWS